MQEQGGQLAETGETAELLDNVALIESAACTFLEAVGGDPAPAYEAFAARLGTLTRELLDVAAGVQDGARRPDCMAPERTGRVGRRYPRRPTRN